MKTETRILENANLNENRNKALAIYIASVTLLTISYSVITAVQYL